MRLMSSSILFVLIKSREAYPKGIFTQAIAKEKIISIAGDSRETYADLSRRVLMTLEFEVCSFEEGLSRR